jgi:uncharacterized protein (DUF1330 family)
MSAYFIANIRVRDAQEYEKYLRDSDEVFARFGGEYLAVDEAPEVLEGGWDYTKTVLIKFPDKEELRRWYDSDAYRRILKYRLGSAECDTIIVQGRQNTKDKAAGV